jgi:hypothetical protein
VAFRTKVGGIEVEADTIAELEALMELYRRKTEKPAPPPAEPKANEVIHVAPPDREVQWRGFARSVQGAESDLQYRLLEMLAKSAGGMNGNDVQAAFGFADGIQLRGSLISLVRRARNAGLPAPIRTSVSRTNGGRKRLYRYSLNRELLSVMRQDGAVDKRT